MTPQRYINTIVTMSGFCLALWSWGCGGDDIVVPGETSVDYAASRARWDEEKSESYRYEFRWICYCTRPHVWAEVTVEGDSVVSVRSLDTLGVDELERREYVTIDSLFGIIGAAEAGAADGVAATYDAEKGFPVQVDIDYNERAIDDELSFTIRKVVFD